MDLLPHLRRLFEYDAWANQEVFEALKRLSSPPGKSVRIAAHIVSAEWLWWNRLNREPQRLPVWPEFDVEEAANLNGELPGIWRNYLAGSPALAENLIYVNSKGESWTSTIHDILTHVVLHSGYHRGQIATDLRAAGFDPPYTDFIHAARKKLI